MPGTKTRAKAAVHAPGDPQPPPKPAPPPHTTHEPPRQVVDEYVKVVGVENVAGTGILFLDCALSVSEIKGLPAIPEDVCSVRERLQKMQQEKSEPLKSLVRVNLQAGSVALSKGVLSNFALGLYHWLSSAPMGNRQGGEGGYFSGLCCACVNTTHEGMGGYFAPPLLGPC